MPRQPRMRGTSNPMASRRGFLAFIVQGLEFQTYFDPTTMTTFGLGQETRPVRIRALPPGRFLRGSRESIESETRRVDIERRRQRMNLQSQRRLKANPEARRERLRRFAEQTDFDKKRRVDLEKEMRRGRR